MNVKQQIGAGVVGLFSAQSAFAETMMLESGDFVGYSFWLISMALAAATIFFLMEALKMGGKWATSLTVSALVTFIAAFHYMYMREVWVATGDTPTDFRYIDWLLTVPLLMIEFYLILAAITKGFWWNFLASIGWYTGHVGPRLHGRSRLHERNVGLHHWNDRMGLYSLRNLRWRSKQGSCGTSFSSS